MKPIEARIARQEQRIEWHVKYMRHRVPQLRAELDVLFAERDRQRTRRRLELIPAAFTVAAACAVLALACVAAASFTGRESWAAVGFGLGLAGMVSFGVGLALRAT